MPLFPLDLQWRDQKDLSQIESAYIRSSIGTQLKSAATRACMRNVRSSAISTHNQQILQSTLTEEPVKSKFNCKIKSKKPSSLAENIIYNAQVPSTNDNDVKEYIGLTATTFNER